MRQRSHAWTLAAAVTLACLAAREARGAEVVVEEGIYEGNSFTIARDLQGANGDLVILLPPLVDFFENDPQADNAMVQDRLDLVDIGYSIASVDSTNYPGLRLRERVQEIRDFVTYVRGVYSLPGDVFLTGAPGTGPLVHLSLQTYPGFYRGGVAVGGFTDVVGQLDFLQYSLLEHAWSFQGLGEPIESILLLQDLLDGPLRDRATQQPNPLIPTVSPVERAAALQDVEILVHGDSDLRSPIFHLWEYVDALAAAGKQDRSIAFSIPASGELAPGGDLETQSKSLLLECIIWAKTGTPPHYAAGQTYGPRDPSDEGIPRVGDVAAIDSMSVLSSPLLLQHQGIVGQGSYLAGWNDSLRTVDLDGDGLSEILFGNAEGFVEIFSAAGGSLQEVARSADLGSLTFALDVAPIEPGAPPKIVAGTFEGRIHVLSGEAPFAVESVYDDPFHQAILDLSILPADGGGGGGATILYRTLDGYVIALDATSLEETARSPYLGPTLGCGMTVADSDADGVLDILVGTVRGVVRKLRRGDLSLVADSPPLGFHPWRIHVADISGRGKPTILVNGGYDRGTPTGTTVALRSDLTERKRTTSLGQYFGFEGADLDGEGVDDLLFGSLGSLGVLDLPERNMRSWQHPDPNAMLTGIAFANVAGGSAPEIVAVTREGSIHILDPATLNEIVPSRSGMAGAYGLALVDLIKTGPSPEIVVGTRSERIQVLDGKGLGGVVSFDRPDGWAHAIEAGDIDGNGQREIVLGTGPGIRERVEDLGGFLDVADRRGTIVWTSLDPGVAYQNVDGSLWGLALADVSGDGISEIIAGNDTSPDLVSPGHPLGRARIRVLDGRTRGILAERTLEGHDLFAIAVGDVTGDGSPEIVVGDRRGYIHLLRLDAGAGTLAEVATTADLGTALVGLAVGDVDGDSAPEILAGFQDGFVRVLGWDGSGLAEVGRSADLGSDAFGILVFDFDGSGSNEIVVGNANGDVFLFDSSLTLLHRASGLGAFAGAYNALEAGDIDGDGAMELCVGTSGYLHVFDIRSAFAPGGGGAPPGGGLPTGYAHTPPPGGNGN